MAIPLTIKIHALTRHLSLCRELLGDAELARAMLDPKHATATAAIHAQIRSIMRGVHLGPEPQPAAEPAQTAGANSENPAV